MAEIEFLVDYSKCGPDSKDALLHSLNQLVSENNCKLMTKDIYEYPSVNLLITVYGTQVMVNYVLSRIMAWFLNQQKLVFNQSIISDCTQVSEKYVNANDWQYTIMEEPV
jgi:hypothetical protein